MAALAACLAPDAAASTPIEAPALAFGRRGVQLTLPAVTHDSTHVTITDARTGEILQQRWYVRGPARAPLGLEPVRPAGTGRVTLEIQLAGHAPERVDVWLLPSWAAFIPLLLAIAVVMALRRLATRGARRIPVHPDAPRPRT